MQRIGPFAGGRNGKGRQWVASGVVVHCVAAQMRMHTDSTQRAKSKDEEAWKRGTDAKGDKIHPSCSCT